MNPNHSIEPPSSENTIQPVNELTMTVLMTPDMANFAGNVHGGTILNSSTRWRTHVRAATRHATWSPSASTR